MIFHLATFVIGLILVIFSTIKLRHQKKKGNPDARFRFDDDTNADATFPKKKQLLASEILKEMEASTEEMIRRLSNKEMELESFMNRADNKISKLQEMLDKEVALGKIDMAAGESDEDANQKSNRFRKQAKVVNDRNQGEMPEKSQNPALKTKMVSSSQNSLNLYNPANIAKKKKSKPQSMDKQNKEHATSSSKENEEKTKNTINEEIWDNDACKNNNMINFYPKYLEKHKHVIDFWQKGWTITEIAQETGKGKGEIQLMINLYRQNGGAGDENRS